MPREQSAPHKQTPVGGNDGFVDLLFGQTNQEDLNALDAQSMAILAQNAQSHLSEPRLDVSNIRLTDVDLNVAGMRREITVIEIINDNMTFLLDSTLAEIVDQGHELHLVAHPVLNVERDAKGNFINLSPTETPKSRKESLIHIHIDRVDNEAARQKLVDGLNRTYTDVRLSVKDWDAMRSRLSEVIDAYKTNPPPLPKAEIEEAVEFLTWIVSDNFALLGIREYAFPNSDINAEPEERPGFGVLTDPKVRVLRKDNEFVVVTPEIRDFLQKPVAMLVVKANVKSRVHRRVHMDYIGVKLFTPAGKLTGELRIVGLFTSNAYTGSPKAIPFLRHKVQQIVERASFDKASYAGRALINVLESYPRDELFQIDIDTLHTFALSVLRLSERPRVRALARIDQFDRFVSIIVYVPKDRYDTSVRRRIGEYLARAYEGRLSASYPFYPEGPLARTQFIVGRDGGKTPQISQEKLEAGIIDIVRTWGDSLRQTLEANKGGSGARALAHRYADAFTAAYREAFNPEQALEDIAVLESLSATKQRAVSFYRRANDPDTRANLKVFARGAAVPLSSRVPLLENLGFRVVNERTYRVLPTGFAEDERVWLHDMSLERVKGGAIDVATVGARVEAALMAQFRGLSESDEFDTLVLEAGLGWRDVAMVRTLGRYLRQIRTPYGQEYIAQTLASHPAIAADLVQLFYARFDPRLGNEEREQNTKDVKGAIEAALSSVTSLDDDRILRKFVNLMEGAVRTNFFQLGANGMPRETIAFKFASQKIDDLPLPRPLYEIFIYSPRVEGVHLRFGKVARGGLRWSDRPQDFRTEILGLVKAQQVKNAVIVPVGAKGGFVPKQLPPIADRQAWLNEGTEAYRIFIRTLLELTDNIQGTSTIAPLDTVRHDGDDPYLVVAADKGTATFSDTANALSLEKGHWLGDAFASGGSQGYDHKKMGITARGAWEAVKRHFREMNIDIQTQSVSVAGVGDMSGDVFGNGMLLSPCLKVVAAFDHRDIFLDPTPDPATSFAERQRLFDLPRSSWQDYNASLLSKGGGIYPRSSKSIPLSPEVRAVLDLDKSEATPTEVMNAILKSQVDLMWFGGIGTYIRAADETDEQVGDRANDSIRITGSELRAKVIGEGANLGVTQKGRIEAAQKGVRMNTDAIDNSAGVNTSDVEVNIKIALAVPESDGRLSQDARNTLLANMTDEVGELVLRNNYLQTLSLSLFEKRGVSELGYVRRFMRHLEQEGRLDRAVEYLPNDNILMEMERRNQGLSRAEIAVLLAYAKLALHDALLASDVPDEPYLARELVRYFPKELQERFPDTIQSHRLRREIVATQLANAMINRGGVTLITRLMDQTGAEAPAIARAYALARDAYGLIELNNSIDDLDRHIDGSLQLDLYARVQELMYSRLVWFLRHVVRAGINLEDAVALYAKGITEVSESLSHTLTPIEHQRLENETAALVAQGVPEALATRLVRMPVLAAAPDIVLVAGKTGRAVKDVAATHFAVGEAFKLDDLIAEARTISTSDYYDRLALDRAIDSINAVHRTLTGDMAAKGLSGATAIPAWVSQRGPEAKSIQETVDQIVASGLNLSKLTLAASLLGDLVTSS
jgi:glutamate dehydrogenase